MEDEKNIKIARHWNNLQKAQKRFQRSEKWSAVYGITQRLKSTKITTAICVAFLRFFR